MIDPFVLSPDTAKLAIRESCLKNFSFFVKWVHKTRTNVDLNWNWHIDVICRHCDALYDSSILKLTVSIPPRSLKSTIFSQYFPVWLWLKDPSLSILNASYNSDLANRDAQVSKEIIESDWFQEVFGDLLKLGKLDRDGYVTHRGGRRQALGVQGKATGYGGDIIIIDDYISVGESHSKVMRENGLQWFRETMTSRANNPKTARWVVIAQRTHVEDLTGWIMANLDDWEHLILPVLYDGVKRETSLGVYDVRKEIGDILHPAMMGEKEIERYKISLGEFGFQAQYMQVPAIRGGNFFKWENFNVVDKVDDCVHSAIFVDTAIKGKDYSDYTVFALCGFTRSGGFHIFEIRRGHWTFELFSMQKQLLAFAKEVRTRKDIGTFEGILVEAAFAGLNLVQTIKYEALLDGLMVRELKPPRTETKRLLKDKATRAQDFSPIVEAGRVSVAKGKWLNDFRNEVEAFTLDDTHRFDDQIDAVMMGYEHFAKLLKLQYERLRK